MAGAAGKLHGMSGPDVVRLNPQAAYDRKVRIARTIVLWLACFVGLTLAVAAVFGAYNLATDRPAKELFLGPSR